MTDQEIETPAIEYRGTGFYVSLVVTALVVLALLVLALQNTESVTFEFLSWDIEIPLFGLIIISVLLAIAIDELVGLVWRRRRRRLLSDRRELAQLRQGSAAKVAVDVVPLDDDATPVSED
jgi:uncharacterized integral membrane protein